MKKTMMFLLCVVILLLGCVRMIAGYDYHGVLLAYNYGAEVGDLPAVADFGDTDQYKSGARIDYGDYCIFQNRFGKVALTRIDYGGTYKMEPVGTFLPKLKTHFNMLSLREGMSVAQLIQAAGAPNGKLGSGIVTLAYMTADGYCYNIYCAESDDGVTYWNIYDASGNLVDKTVFQWTVRLAYLGAAVLLSGVLVVLLTVPKAIRRRKEKLKTDNG